jgi:hypothetical protein
LVKKKCLLGVGGFDENIAISDDYDLYLRIAHRYPISFVRECLYKWRFRESNQSGCNNDIRMFRWRKGNIKVLEKNRNIIPEDMKYHVDKRLTELYWKCGWYHFHSDQFENSRDLLIKCLRGNWGHARAVYYLLATFIPLGLVKRLRSLKRRIKRKDRRQSKPASGTY